MKKSPLSRISGNRGHIRSPYGHRHFHNSNNHDNLNNGINYHGLNRQDHSQASGGCDYIPFESSSPLSQRSNSGSWQGSGYSSGYKSRGQNYYSSPISNHSSPYSSYNNTPKHNYKRQVTINFLKLENEHILYFEVRPLLFCSSQKIHCKKCVYHELIL